MLIHYRRQTKHGMKTRRSRGAYLGLDKAVLTLTLLAVLAAPLAFSQPPKIFFAESGNGGRIHSVNSDGSGFLTVVPGATGAWGFDLDVLNGKLYWADRDNGAIRRSNLDGTNIETLVTGLSIPVDVKLDVVGGKMYFINEGNDVIQRANLDGSNVESLLTGPTGCTHGLALDVSAGKMYWTDCVAPMIHRANLDGTNVEVVIADIGGGAIGMALDLVAGKMYIGNQGTDQIQQANLDGTGLVNIVPLTAPMGIVVDNPNGKIYFTNRGGIQGLRRANLDGSNVEDLVVTGLISPAMLALDVAPAVSLPGASRWALLATLVSLLMAAAVVRRWRRASASSN